MRPCGPRLQSRLPSQDSQSRVGRAGYVKASHRDRRRAPWLASWLLPGLRQPTGHHRPAVVRRLQPMPAGRGRCGVPREGPLPRNHALRRVPATRSWRRRRADEAAARGGGGSNSTEDAGQPAPRITIRRQDWSASRRRHRLGVEFRTAPNPSHRKVDSSSTVWATW